MNAKSIAAVVSAIKGAVHALSPAAHQVYAIYVREAALTGYQYLMAAGAWGFGAVLIGAFSFFCYRKEQEFPGDGWGIGALLAFLGVLGCLIGMFVTGLTSFDFLMNPAYWAIQGILGR